MGCGAKGGFLANLLISQIVTRQVGPLDLLVEGGECVCVSGASGSGKSLLLRAIADLDPHEGELRLGDTRACDVPAPAWRRRVGMLPAESSWWYPLVGEHFAEPARVEWAALGFEAGVADWQVARLSTGERQRLALLRLLQNRPEVLLLDEPTASLDKIGVERVEALVADYARKRGAPVIWVSHDAEQIARVADRHFELREGGLRELTAA